MKKLRAFFLALVAIGAMIGSPQSAAAAGKTHFKVAWSHYTGWEPWQYAKDSGIMKKWADKYGIQVEIVFINDYVETINQYSAGAFDGLAVTNMDVLDGPSAGGVDSTALIVGDYSNGNDGVVCLACNSVKDMKGRDVQMVEGSVSHYLLARALELNGLREADLKVVNTSDADIASLFAATKDPRAAVVTWNPILMGVRMQKNATMVFDSSKTPGEILDLMVVRTDSPDSLKKALTGAWYEMMKIMNTPGADREKAVSSMASFAGGTKQEFESQLKTTRMYYDPSEASLLASGEVAKKTMEYVRTFIFDHGLFTGAKSKDAVGIQFPDGTIQGNPKNVKLRFDSKYMQLAADGKLEVASK